MAGFHDVYVLSDQRSKAEVTRFLDRFLPEREEVADDYAVPHLSDRPEIVFAGADDLLTYLGEHPDRSHGIYWASRAVGDPRFAMIFPTTDGQVVYGLSVERDAAEFLAELKAHLGSPTGYVDFENPPPDNAPDFVKMAAELGGLS
jgi:hypothetical protein